MEARIIQDVINIDPEIMSGVPVFKGTRVHIKTLFDHLENGIPLEEFLEDFPSVSREQALKVIAIARQLVMDNNFLNFTQNKPA